MMNDNQALRAAGVLLALDGQHLLHQAQAQAVGLVGVERIAGEQPAHGVAPAGDLVHTQGGAAEGEDAALHFHLGEAGVAGAQVDVRGENQFDADGVAIALRRDYHRFARPWAAEHPQGSQPPAGICQPAAKRAATLARSSPALKCSPWAWTSATRASPSRSNSP